MKIISRNEWGADQQLLPTKSLIPFWNISCVLISQTNSETCFYPEECTSWMIKYQERGVYNNFVIGGDGLVYADRGWDTLVTRDGVFRISFIGVFDNQLPTNVQFRSAQLLIELGMNLEKIAKDYTLHGCPQINSNEDGPGDKLYELIKTLGHWHPYWT